MIDIHSHILPDVDDGAKTWEIALQMCAMAWQDGIEHMVATPHANEEYFYDRPYYLELRKRLMDATEGKPEISIGCDFHLSFENIQDALANPRKYTIGDTPYLLVEFSEFSIPAALDDSLRKFIEAGLRPIITHPERNPILQRTPERVLDWVRLGCPVQITANSLTGRWGRKADACARWLFEHRAVHFLATDAHNLDSRPPILSEACEIARHYCGDGVAEAIVKHNPGAVIRGEALPYFSKSAGAKK